ncbi:MAG: class I SAM-dependent methyltransferase [Deltaproteobacteria bacterium]|nr:class I SAM-dependent methyltransferase [Deltaproteobacteria bacterium]
MEKVTDWKFLWKELVEKQGPFWNRKKRSRDNRDKWKDRSQEFYNRVKKRWSKPDLQRDFIVSMISSVNDATVLDIGAGTGAWAVYLARSAKKITAIEPSAEMRQILRENIKNEGVDNVEVIDKLWPAPNIITHDFSLASHSVYGCEDLRAFIGAMTRVTRHTCFMLLRAPDNEGFMARAAGRIWGQPYDSPNFQVAYNVMLQMGMFPNVIMEEKGMWPRWTDKDFEEAFERIRARFGLEKDSEHEPFLRALLKEHLNEKDGIIKWPSELRTGLVYWNLMTDRNE